MGEGALVKSNYDGKCSKCQAAIKVGDKVFIKKGQPRLCEKCAPPGAKEKKDWAPKTLDLPTQVAFEAMKGILIRHPQLKADELAMLSWKASDKFIEQRAARGIR